ncbi:hypothetical protein [Klenkia brasiliensis]|uniref:Uncharacterized protein n=1 Tax=Klenkia brasiliensis TaxID=333142 RepID=A0A1G7MFT2_9ACTN|nr:hypothetical protein [Klenkia brasiliensis]SDF60561.1 hypothetical protein SAMN05660324_0619 [Klenkia brasiliensis]
MESRDDAAASLAALDTDRAALADRARQPRWYDPALGVLLGGFLATYSFAFPWATLAALPVFAIGTGLLAAAYRRHTGMWVSGFHGSPSTRPLVRVWALACAVVLAVGLVAELVLDVRYAMVGAGVLLGVGAAVLSSRWTTAYQRDLRAGR